MNTTTMHGLRRVLGSVIVTEDKPSDGCSLVGHKIMKTPGGEGEGGGP